MVCHNHGDFYEGEDGTFYVATHYPSLMDPYGVLRLKQIRSEMLITQGKNPFERLAMNPPSSIAIGSKTTINEPTGSGKTTNSYVEELLNILLAEPKTKALDSFSEWKCLREVSIVKVLQNNDSITVFSDESYGYYATPKMLHSELLADFALTAEQSDSETRIRDSYGNVYRTLEWAEIHNFTWKGHALFVAVDHLDAVRARDQTSSVQRRELSHFYPRLVSCERTPIQLALVSTGNARTYEHSFRRNPNVGSQGPLTAALVPRLTYEIQSQNQRSLPKLVQNERSFYEDHVQNPNRELQGPRQTLRPQLPTKQTRLGSIREGSHNTSSVGAMLAKGDLCQIIARTGPEPI